MLRGKCFVYPVRRTFDTFTSVKLKSVGKRFKDNFILFKIFCKSVLIALQRLTPIDWLLLLRHLGEQGVQELVVYILDASFASFLT